MVKVLESGFQRSQQCDLDFIEKMRVFVQRQTLTTALAVFTFCRCPRYTGPRISITIDNAVDV